MGLDGKKIFFYKKIVLINLNWVSKYYYQVKFPKNVL